MAEKKLIYRNEDDNLVVDDSLDGNKVVLYENDDIKIETTGHFYDFIATVSNFGTKCTIVFTGNAEYVEDFTVDGNDWVGIEANDAGWETLEAIVNGDFRIEREETFEDVEEDEILATLKSTNTSSADLDRDFCNRVVALIESKNKKIEDLEVENENLKESLLEEMYGDEEKEKIRAEAIKEFAERLKEKYWNIPMWGKVAVVYMEEILKGMVGDNNG